MPTNHTPHYNLSQWERDDRVLMEDFNADNAKIDAAIKAEAEARAAVGAELNGLRTIKGNCQLDAFTYTGTGKYGSQNPNRIQFTHGEAALVIIAEFYGNFLLVHKEVPGSSGINFNWTPAGLSWYGSSARDQRNNQGETYHVFVFYALK